MYDVVIVGGGPVGLFLACELGLAGCAVLVLEREPESRTPGKALPLGMRGLNAGSVEAFYRRGMLADLGVADDPHTTPRNLGHFAGIMLDAANVDLATLPSPALEGHMTSLEAVETILAERAAKLGVHIERAVTVDAIDQDDQGVVARAGSREYRARWLVGCDGGRSVVRKTAGFEFTGTGPQLTGYVALTAIADPEKLSPGFNLTPHGMYLRTPIEGHLGMMDFDGGAFDRSRPPTREHLQQVLRRISGTDVTLNEVHQAASFTDRAMQTTTYRRGRVLLAGDAAHIHSPLGGQGLNLGIGDAMNLGWKLAAAVHGHAPDALLDTYTSERHPIGARVLDWSRAQVAVMRPDATAPALQGLIRDLLATRAGATYVFGRVAGLSNTYDVGDAHPLAGRNAPDFRLQDGTRLGDLLQRGTGVLLDFRGDLEHAVAPWADRIHYAAGPAYDDLGLDGVLIRPDGVIAWAGERGGFVRAAAHWFGAPTS
ncbi:FAD-dependent monooxygenase [Actinoplanes sichuanensis]|uniref:FAD-dependent monooxygenase n=1 Tax=Actinoplanes sichuanensis TaxID=512349 RepID=A0ABW4A1E2_9ACTN|nr:FAD-dependent monooxygenase [Actinoplanes sichuanensis]BEL04283.1 FAD-dependent monooxygenase [Actinoplanes sichuanensis]